MAVAKSRRLWCSCVVIDYLKGEARAKTACESIIKTAEAGETEIVVSAVCLAEVITVESGPDSIERIGSFFRQPYVVVAQVDFRVGEIAADIRRKTKLKTLDALHLATAVRFAIPTLETFDDDDLIPLDGQFGDPAVLIRHPRPEAQTRLPI